MPSCGVYRPSVCPAVCKHLRKSLLRAGKWLDRDQTHSSTNLPFPFSIAFSSDPNPQIAVSLRYEFCQLSHRPTPVYHIVHGICVRTKGLKDAGWEAERSDELSIASSYSMDKGDDRHLLCAADAAFASSQRHH